MKTMLLICFLLFEISFLSAQSQKSKTDDYQIRYGINNDPILRKTQAITWTSFAQFNNSVTSIVKDANNNVVYAGGNFTVAGDGAIAFYIAKWNVTGSFWTPLGFGTNDDVASMALSGGNLYVGGLFTLAGGISANRIAKWDGTTWSALGDGFPVNTNIFAIAINETDVYAGGTFTTASAAIGNRIAKWNGTNWSALGTGLNQSVFAIAINGTDVYVGGAFTTAGGNSANYVAKWDGANWSALGNGLGNSVSAIAIKGTDIYVGGTFTQDAIGNSLNYIAKWNGATWSALGTGLNGRVRSIVISGDDVYVGGDFTTAGGISANHLAKWNITNSTWSSIGNGTGATGVNALAISSTEGAMYIGGSFTTVDGTNTASPYFAKFTDSENPLPVELMSFSASVAGTDVNLSWQTATELNNYGFEIERAAVIPNEVRNLYWEKIGFVPGTGNSNSPKDYTFTDQPTGGTSFSYRLKQIDVDGKFKYYDAVTVTLFEKQTAELMDNYPNPFNPSTAIKFYIPNNSEVLIKIYDMLGKEVTTLINKQTEAGYHIVYWNGRDSFGNSVSSGVYLYRITSGSFIETKKMSLLK